MSLVFISIIVQEHLLILVRLENIDLEALADSFQAEDIENLKHLKELMTLSTDNIDVKNSEVMTNLFIYLVVVGTLLHS